MGGVVKCKTCGGKMGTLLINPECGRFPQACPWGFHFLKVKEYERQIDQIVYKLYNLTEEETEIINKL